MSRNILDIKGLFNHKFSSQVRIYFLTAWLKRIHNKVMWNLLNVHVFFSFTCVYDEVNFVDIFSLFVSLFFLCLTHLLHPKWIFKNKVPGRIFCSNVANFSQVSYFHTYKISITFKQSWSILLRFKFKNTFSHMKQI